MIRHIVLQRWMPEVGDAEQIAIVRALRECVAGMPGIIDLIVERSLALGGGTFDAALVVDFEDEQAFRGYQASDAHRDFLANVLGPKLADRASIQLELADRDGTG